MKRKRIHSMIPVFLALLMLLLPACNKKKPTEETPATSEERTDQTDPMELVPKGDYNYEDFIVVSPVRTWANTSMTSESFNGDAINDAIFTRTAKVSNRLKINIVDRIVTNVQAAVQTAIQGGSHEFDLLQLWPSDALVMYQQGLCADQTKIKTMNLNHDWWEQRFNEEVNVGAAKYVTFSQASLILYYGLYIYAFNKAIVDGNQLDNPYDLVADKTWTWDKVYSMMREVTTDHTGNGSTPANGDTIGLVGHINHCQGVMLSSGQMLGSRDASGVLSYSGLSEGYRNAFEKYVNYFVGSPYVAIAGTKDPSDFSGYNSTTGYADYLSFFNEGKALFLTTGTNEVSTLRRGNVEYGIVVAPKYDENQTEYITPVYRNVDGFAVPNFEPSKGYDTDYFNRVGIVLDTLGAASYNYLIAEHRENVLYYKVAKDPVAREMIKQAYSNPMIDVMLSNNFGTCADTIQGLIAKRNPSTTAVDSIKLMINKALQKAQTGS